ncbi:HutD/Ves family protein [Pseudoduganella chitinolytica]|uniref:HutD family protein n=1 Tax=Pseudoduganella chitinolytica TaxID=34070 RepID=A0ABY8B5X4_9BURK|nr:HutD family protein [Pseudoduganella chitinolytica]WEF31335.1 HutD family protein [Pseudoduganella chitinolytica]
MTTLIQYASLNPTPWKNGGGCTTEIMASPPGATLHDFDWRISLATIAQSGPFSVFPGIDRTLTLVDGGNVVLDVGNERKVALSEREPVVAFPGEVPVNATVDGDPTTDFNVMTRRERCSHQLERRLVRDFSVLERRSALTVLFLAEGESLTVYSSRERMVLVRYDAVVLDREERWTLEAPSATVFIVDIMPNEEDD